MFDKQEMAARLRSRRSYLNYNQKHLSTLTGLSVTYLSEIEAGKRLPSAEVVYKLSQALDLTSDHILGLAE